MTELRFLIVVYFPYSQALNDLVVKNGPITSKDFGGITPGLEILYYKYLGLYYTITVGRPELHNATPNWMKLKDIRKVRLSA